jgi:pyrroline-5-carboxylate reductase
MNYGFIGFGNLAKAIHQGLKENPQNNFAYFSRHDQKNEIIFYNTPEQLIDNSQIIWLCVKPQNLAEILSALKNAKLSGKLIVSPVAGKSLGYIKSHLGQNADVARIMPNLAIAYKNSVTAFCLETDNLLAETLRKDLQTLGEVVELPEKDFDLFTAVFGSGPAFLLEILKVFRDNILKLNLPEAEADKLLLALAAGTLDYFRHNCRQKNIAELIGHIASKGGTTEAGLDYFQKNKLDELLNGMIEAAQKRSGRLAK